jgi:hypothetical protein
MFICAKLIIFVVFIKKKFVFMGEILNEELIRMKYLFEHQRGVVISEQSGYKYNPKLPIRKNVELAGGDWLSVKNEFNSSGTAADNMNISNAMKDGWLPGQPVPEKYKIKSTYTPPTDWFTATSSSAQGVFDQLAEGKDKMNGKTFNTFGFFENKGRVDGVASNLPMNELITKSKEFGAVQNFDSYTYPQMPKGGFVAGYIGNFGFKMTDIPSDSQDSGDKEIQNKTEQPVQSEQPEQSEIDIMINDWCEANELLADEECYPVRNLEYNQARRQSSVNATKAEHPYKRDEFWDESTKTYIAIYGLRSRSIKQLKQRNKLKMSGSKPTKDMEEPVTPTKDMEVKQPSVLDPGVNMT